MSINGTLRSIDTGFLRRWLDDATLRNARGRALEISHAEYSDTVLAYLDPVQHEQLQDEDTWIARGLWALPDYADFSPYAIIPQLLRATKGEKADVRGYVSLLCALNLHGMIDQVPHVIQIVAERIRPTVRTSFGTYQFHGLDPALIGGYGPYRNTGNFDIATPAKALFDALYLSTRRGRRLRHFPELSWPANFSRRELREWIAKIDDPKLRVVVAERWDVLRSKSPP